MTIIQLEYIIAVDTHRHFGKAADSCFVTQPTLSMQIQKLEDRLGVILFDRGKQPVVPTEIGKRIIDQARVVVNEAKRITEMVTEEKGEVAGELSIGIIPTLSPYLTPLFIHDFVEKFPNVRVKIFELVTDELMNKLKNDTIDVGILVTPINDGNLKELPLFHEEFVAYVSHRNDLYKKEVVHVDDIEDTDVWLLNEGHCFREQVLNLCKNYKERDSRLKYESGSLEALKKMVDMHGGLTLLPELATLDLNSTERKKLRTFQDPKPVREVSLVMHKSFMKKQMVDALREAMLAAIPNHLDIKKNAQVIKWR